MKVKYIGETDPIGLQNGRIYDVIEISKNMGWYRIETEFDDEEEGYPPGYLYSPKGFIIVEE